MKEKKKAKENFKKTEDNNVMVQMRIKLEELQKISYGTEGRGGKQTIAFPRDAKPQN